MIHIWEQLAYSLLTLDPTLALRRGGMGWGEGFQAATGPTAPLYMRGLGREW